MKYCSHCGNELIDEAVVCPSCGCSVAGSGADVSEKSWISCILLCFFLGAFGIHRFYVGKVGSGIFMLLTLGFLGIWTLVDFIIILCGNFTDGKGKVIKNK